MNMRKRFTDYPTSFWFAVLATITAAILAISSYSRMINDDAATMKAAMIVISFEGALIVAMAVMNGRLQGLLKGWAFVMLFMLATAEIFMASMEIQHGIAQAGANAENFTVSASNAGTVAAGMADATKALADCDKRYPRKKKDADARNQCRKPYEKIVAASAGAMPSGDNAPKYDAEDAGKLKQWQAVADAMNETWQPEKPITWNQAAFYIMTAIMALFVIVKNFLWAKYAHECELKAHLEAGEIYVPESAMGSHETIEDATPDTIQPEKPAFGFLGGKKPAPSTAEANRAANMHVSNSKQASNMHVVHAHVRHEHVEHEHVNNMHVGDNDAAYMHVTNAKIGTTCNCPQCGTEFVKRNKWHTFCNPKCRDSWHNDRDPNRRAYLAKKRK